MPNYNGTDLRRDLAALPAQPENVNIQSTLPQPPDEVFVQTAQFQAVPNHADSVRLEYTLDHSTYTPLANADPAQAPWNGALPAGSFLRYVAVNPNGETPSAATVSV
jgi:hypothetical protein